MSVVTRFAPSPTGYLHIGGARTALFNYLFARHHGGQYLLRIEDTDKERSTEAAKQAIHDGLNWLGLSGDQEPLLQSTREDRHREIAQELVAKGHAYRCYLTADELDDLRSSAREDGRSVRSPYRAPDFAVPSDRTDYVVRLKMPSGGTAEITDLVQGTVSVSEDQLDDMVLLRSDGTPTYMLAVVVDDHDMGITHILRGDDHLNNAFRQQQIYLAMGWDVPVFGHIPLIHGPDGAKLSKRHGALGVGDYADMGFLPEAMLNYLARLGWSHGDDELFDMTTAASWFDGSSIGRSPARFDMDKLRAVNAHWLRQRSTDWLVEQTLKAHPDAVAQAPARLHQLMPLLSERAQMLGDIADNVGYLVQDGVPAMTEEAAALLDDEAKARLACLAADMPDELGDLDSFKSWFNDWMASKEWKMKQMGLPLRAVLTGTKTSPSITDIMVALGATEVRNRIQKVCN